MPAARRKFRREGEAARREALIAAALDMVAEKGPQAATVRAIAERAGVTPGLIRHYFATKRELARTAFGIMMDRLHDIGETAIDRPGLSPAQKLAGFVVASLRPPSTDPEVLTQWAAFIHMIRSDEAMRSVHEAAYRSHRDRLAGLISEAVPDTPPSRLRSHTIACNGLIDGLWLAGCALSAIFDPDELARIGLSTVGAIVGLDLLSHAPKDLT